MAIKSRSELEAYFKNGKKPSQKEFADLVASTLNKRDDQFFGRWKAGATYRKGDIVTHDRALWEMHADSPICSHNAPDEGETWRILLVQNDGDWFIQEVGGEESVRSVMYTRGDVSAVGIGTEAPQARLDVQNRDGAGHVLHLGDFGQSSMQISCSRLAEEESTRMWTILDEARTVFSSDAPDGFLFHRPTPSTTSESAGDSNSSDEGEASASLSGSFSLEELKDGVLMIIQPDTDRKVRVGIGTREPRAMLDVTDGTRGRFLFNPEDKHDPAFSIINLDPASDPNYLAGGVGAGQAVFVSDAPDGFVFKQGEEYDAYESVTNINQGRPLMIVKGNEESSRVGIGVEPDNFELDVSGRVQTFGLYTAADESEISEGQPLEDVLESLQNMRPIRFEWAEATGLQEAGEQFGFLAAEVDAVFPQVVREGSVAYQNLVPVLVQAINELQASLAEIEDRLESQQEAGEELQSRVNTMEDRTEEQQQYLENLETRIQGAEERLETIGEQVNGTEEQLENLTQRVDDLEPRMNDLEQRMETVEDQIGT
jgi:prefoldin subunit 5